MPRNIVLQSIETPDGDRCIDIFERPDGSFGFEGYRRDPEDPRGWYPVTTFGNQRYEDATSALAAASGQFPWIDGSANNTTNST